MKRLLVANRGEIALRVIRAARVLGIETVAVYSTADADSLHVRAADDAVCIGPPAASESYLNVPAILSAARIAHADAVHPGYGFLAENARFAELVKETGLRFVGPSPEAIRKMGDKVEARRIAKEAGVPLSPGTEGALASPREAAARAAEVGYPVLLKAAAGGGGRGMRRVDRPEDLPEALRLASEEARKAFGDGRMYLERFVTSARHVEIQVAGDGKNAVHFGERDCSIQRRHQKLVEEAPSPVLDERTRAAMGEAACRLAEAVGYRTVGTVEFLYDEGRGEFYFMEMNTRIQVEHPVTEEATGADLVALQFVLAEGETLAAAGYDAPPAFTAHAVECRINAEDPENDFRPQAGRVESLVLPGGPGIRLDTHLYGGYEVPPHYDSLLAKVIAKGRDRAEAIARLKGALLELDVGGLPTTRGFHLRVVDDPVFREGRYNTQYVHP